MHIVRFCFAIVGTQAHAAEPDRRDLVFFAVGCEGDIAGIEFEDLLPAYLGQAEAFGDVQGLPAVMGNARRCAPWV